MLEGWRVQQLARTLALRTVDKRLAAIRAFTRHADAFPWAWAPQMLDEWLGTCGRWADFRSGGSAAGGRKAGCQHSAAFTSLNHRRYLSQRQPWNCRGPP